MPAAHLQHSGVAGPATPTYPAPSLALEADLFLLSKENKYFGKVASGHLACMSTKNVSFHFDCSFIDLLKCWKRSNCQVRFPLLTCMARQASSSPSLSPLLSGWLLSWDRERWTTPWCGRRASPWCGRWSSPWCGRRASPRPRGCCPSPWGWSWWLQDVSRSLSRTSRSP